MTPSSRLSACVLGGALAVAACRGEPTPLAVDGKSVYRTADGQRWRLTRVAGAVPEPTYEQSYVRLERLAANDELQEVFNFEERAWVRPDGAERTWVVFVLDRGELQALQHQREPGGKEKLTRMRWNGTRFQADAPEMLGR